MPSFAHLPQEPQLSTTVQYGDFRDGLAKDGFAVVPQAIPHERAGHYADQAQSWLESFGLGYRRDDPSTWKDENLPLSFKGGLYNRYGAAHEQFCWDIRQEPGVVDAFAKIWGTRDLLVSFDGLNLSVPGTFTQGDSAIKPWPHVDQSPLRPFLHCIQGIVNLAPNGENDGGLKVMKGSRLLFEELFDHFKKDMPKAGWSERDVFVFNDEQLAWLEDKGCTWHKINANPGDLILWDSRTTHYGALPTSNNFRIATYVCYKPRALATEEQIEAKAKMFCNYAVKLTHDPINPGVLDAIPSPGTADPAYKIKSAPSQPPVLSELGRKLAALEAY